MPDQESDHTTDLQDAGKDTEKHRFPWSHNDDSGDPVQMADPTPIYISHRTRTIIILLALVLFVFLLRTVPSIVSTVLLGATLALVLSFPVRLLQRKFSRKTSVTIVTLSMLIGTVLILVLIVPILISEITDFVSALPSIVDTIMKHSREILGELHDRGYIQKSADEYMDDFRIGLLDTAQSLLSSGLTNLVSTLSASVSIFITAFGVVFVATYLLADMPRFHQSYLRLWAPQYRADGKVLWDTMGYSLSRYLSAQVVSLGIQGAIAFVGLSVLGVPYALVLGLVQAITAILPYIGAWIAAVPAVLVALTVSWQMAIWVVILYLALNQLEGNLITPNLQGNAVKVHPILIFIGVIGGGQVFGIMGAILAVPTIALIRVISEFYWLRVRVAEDKPTVLALMRNDTAGERIGIYSAATKRREPESASEPVDSDHLS